MSYMNRATNNLYNLGPHGWFCIYCFGKGMQHEIKQTCDDCTAICPKCGIDSCVPGTDFNKKSLSEWRLWGFGAKYPDHYTQVDIDNFMAEVDHNTVDESEPPDADPTEVMANQVEDMVLPAVDPAADQDQNIIIAVARDEDDDLPQGNG